MFSFNFQPVITQANQLISQGWLFFVVPLGIIIAFGLFRKLWAILIVAIRGY